MKHFLFLIVLLSLATGGCSFYRVSSEEVTNKFYASKRTPEDVRYIEEVTGAHEIIGFVTVNAERSQNMQEILYRIRREAAILGGDAITNITSNATGTWKKLPPQKILENAYIRANFTATVIAFPE